MDVFPGFNVTWLRENARMKEERYRHYRMKFEQYPVYNIVEHMPPHLDLELTARCQLKCPGCPSMKLDYEKGDMPYDVALSAVHEFGSMGGMAVKFNWRGEPTLYKRLYEIIAAAKKVGLMDRMINTNGIAIDTTMSYRLIESGLSTIIFSIDSTKYDVYKKLRVGATLDKALRGLRSFCEIAEGTDVLIRVQRIEYPNAHQESHKAFVEFFEEKFPRVNAVASNKYKEKSMKGCDSPSNPCAQLWQRILIAYDGTVGACCEMNRLEPLGKFPENDLFEIWRGARLEALRNAHWQGEQNGIEGCRKCMVTKV